MTTSLLGDAFAHDTWATLRLLDACAALTPEQLKADVPGTPGSILRTLQHIVGSDAFDLLMLTGDQALDVETKQMGLAELRDLAERTGPGWARFLAQHPDPDTNVHEVDHEDGFQRDAPVGIRLAQALHHGNDHRSQVCSALTALGIESPDISVFDFGLDSGRSTEVMP